MGAVVGGGADGGRVRPVGGRGPFALRTRRTYYPDYHSLLETAEES